MEGEDGDDGHDSSDTCNLGGEEGVMGMLNIRTKYQAVIRSPIVADCFKMKFRSISTYDERTVDSLLEPLITHPGSNKDHHTHNDVDTATPSIVLRR